MSLPVRRRWSLRRLRLSRPGAGLAAVYAVWDEGHDARPNLRWLRDAMSGLEDLTSGRYVGESDLVAKPDNAARSFCPAAWRRLSALREVYDPDHLFCGFPGL